MELLDVLANASELSHGMYSMFDDLYDMTTDRLGIESWHLRHPATIVSDTLMTGWSARRMVAECLPRSHPCRDALVGTMQDYYRSCSNYYTYHGEWAACNVDKMFDVAASESGRVSGQRNQFVDDILGSFGSGTFVEFNKARSTSYFQYTVDMVRLYGCYSHPNVQIDTRR